MHAPVTYFQLLDDAGVFIAAYRTNILAGTLYTRSPDATRTIKTDFSSHRCTIRPSTISPDCALRRTVAPSFISDLFFLVIFRFAHANLPGGLRGFYHGTAGVKASRHTRRSDRNAFPLQRNTQERHHQLGGRLKGLIAVDRARLDCRQQRSEVRQSKCKGKRFCTMRSQRLDCRVVFGEQPE